MADLADVMDALERIALETCYPNGTDQPSVSGKDIDVGQGWVNADDLDKGLAEGDSAVSIYAIPSSTSKLPAPLTSGFDAVVVPPMHGLSASEIEGGFTLSGTAGQGEYVTALLNRQAWTYAATQGDTAATVAAGLAALIPNATAVGPSITISKGGHLTVRIGAPGTLGHTIDRQRQNIMLSVWSPSPSDRTVIGRALQVAVAQNLTLTMPDTSMAILQVQGVNLIDKYETELAYRRDLTVQAQWDTTDLYPAYEITVVDVRLSASTERPVV